MIYRLLIIVVLAFSLGSCYYLQPLHNPVESIRYFPEGQDNATNKTQRKLMILLPGLGDKVTAFDTHGFTKTLHNKYPEFDAIALNAHFKYYKNHVIADRIHEDIVLPAIRAGYQDIYIAGNSLGGLGALLYLKSYPDYVHSILPIAPYLGEKKEYQHLLDNSERREGDFILDLWPWITSLSDEQKRKIHLAYGLNDKFAQPNALLSRHIHPEQTITIKGKHRWTTWKQLWPTLLDSALAE